VIGVQNWRGVEASKGTILEIINRNFVSKQHALPSFEGSDWLFIGSDYSGESGEEPYRVFSFIFCGSRSWDDWESKRLELRNRVMPDNRRMAYKNLGDAYRKTLLKPLLDLADQLEGLSVTIAVNKKISSLFMPPEPSRFDDPELRAFSIWKPHVLEKALTIVHFASFMLAGLARPNQNVFWITDQDEIAANRRMLTDLTKAFAWISSAYLKVDLGRFRLGTTLSDPGNCQLEDFVAIPDLLAGAISEQFRGTASVGASDDKVFWLTGAGMKEKAQSILFSWACSRGKLKKHIYVIDPDERPDSHKLSWFSFNEGGPA
jgi:hypothetical protein